MTIKTITYIILLIITAIQLGFGYILYNAYHIGDTYFSKNIIKNICDNNVNFEIYLYTKYNNRRYGIPKKNSFKKEINDIITELEGKCDKNMYEKYIIQTVPDKPKREFIQIGKHKTNVNDFQKVNISKRH